MSDGVLSYDGKVKGEGVLWTDKAHGDFELVVDWRATGPAEIAVYPRSSKQEIALQNTAKKPGAWKRSIVRMKGNSMTLRTDGEIVGKSVEFGGIPATGPIGLASTGPAQFRNVFIRALKAGD